MAYLLIQLGHQILLLVRFILPSARGNLRQRFKQLLFPLCTLIRVNLILTGQLGNSFVASGRSQSNFCLKLSGVITPLVFHKFVS